MYKRTHLSGFSRTALSVLFVAALAACGGGGDSTDGLPGNQGGGGQAGAEVAPATPNGFTAVTMLAQQAARGMKYFVATVGQAASAMVNITLPTTASLAIGDTMTVRGGTSTSWRVVQNDGQTVGTRVLPGGTLPGATFTPETSTEARNWWFTASSSSGARLAAVSNGLVQDGGGTSGQGGVFTSADAGITWTDRRAAALAALPPNAETDGWTSVASSSDGTKLALTNALGFLLTSSDSGATWQRRDAAVNRFWTSVTMSADGTRMVAAVEEAGNVNPLNQARGSSGLFYWSNSPSNTDFFAGAWVRSNAVADDWRSVSSSANGKEVVAVRYTDNDATPANRPQLSVFRSTDYGQTWSSGQSFQSAYRLASSQDGTRVVMAERFGGLWTSTNSGATFTQRTVSPAPPLGAGFNSVSISADGTVLAAVSNSNTTSTGANVGGRLFVSLDGGVSWTARDEVRTWRTVTMADDGNRLIAGVNNGRIYTSTSNRTILGSSGYIQGGKDNEVNLIYRGDGLFDVTSVLPAASGAAAAGAGLTKN